MYHLQAGGIAGLTADIVLFPLDTIKTRLQSSRGFWASGGFHKIYAGIGPAAAGSAPSGKTIKFTDNCKVPLLVIIILVSLFTFIHIQLLPSSALMN